MKECPNGHEVSDMAKFCPKCGAEIQESVAEEVRFCKKCGNERKGAEKFCSHCGNPFNGDPIINTDNPNVGEVVHASSSNKKTIYLLVLLLLLLIGGYFVNNHIQEQKRLEKARIEAAEEEQKRIEEENSPAKKLYKIAQNGSWVWGHMFSKPYRYGTPSDSRRDLYTRFVFLYPISETSGKLSYFEITEESHNEVAYYEKLTSVYHIEDNFLRATLNSFDGFKGKFVHPGYNIVFRIENIGDKVKLIELEGSDNYTWTQMEPLTQKGKRIKDYN